MASTYVNNLRLEEIGTGEQSGTWGDTTNTNLEIIGQAVAWGTRAVANASTDNITITDGALDADRCLGLKLTGGGQACTITLLPNTSSKTWFMYNATAAALTFTCGSGANVIIPAGQTKVIATDGLGSGGVVHDLLTAVNLAGTTQTAAVTTQGTLTVGVDDTGYDVKFFGATSGKSLLWDESADSLIITGTTTLVGTTNLDAVDIDGNVQLDGTFTVGVDDTGKDVKFFGDTSGKFVLFDASADTLSVSGDLATVTAGTSNVVIGVNAGNSIASGGNYNVVVGDEAGTALTTGDDNVAVGFEALSTEDTGTRSVAVGYRALKVQNNDSTNYNVAVGYDAGVAVTTGLQNTLIGALAGDAITVGNNNIAIGKSALSAEVGGQDNVAIGSNALAAQSSSSGNVYNVAIGKDAGAAVTTGVQNTIVGALAGDALTTGGQNVAIGYQALSTDDLGSHNVAIGANALSDMNFATAINSRNVAVGDQAGLRVTTGIRNVLIGGLSGDAFTDADDNVAIGTVALSSDTLGSNSVAVGHQALATQNFTTATDVYNVAMGYNAGVLVETGINNTLIGSLAGSTVTTGDANVCLGYNAGVNQISTADNLLYIARAATAPGNDGTWIHGTASGACINGDNATAWAQTSDRRIKKNIADSSVGLSKINQVKVRNFEYRTFDELDDDVKALNDGNGLNVISKSGTKTGVIAQEIEAIFPSDVQDLADGTKIVTPSDLNYALIKAVQELSTALDAALARITTLEG